MKEFLALGVVLVLLQACPCSVPDRNMGSISGMESRGGETTLDGGTTTERVQTVFGTVSDPDPSTPDVFDGKVVLERNGESQYVTPEWDGEEWSFENDMVLTHGTNSIRVHVEDEYGNEIGGSETYRVTADIPPRDITVTLTWDTDRTDIDLHVFNPGGEHAWYRSKEGISGGFLDVDDTDGYGPETFTMESATPGEWAVKVRYYDTHGVQSATTATVRVTLHEGSQQVYTHTFTSGQANRDDPSNDWEVARFTMP